MEEAILVQVTVAFVIVVTWIVVLGVQERRQKRKEREIYSYD